MSAEKTIGVVVCTYNGEKYLAEQLESILGQTRQPDKILIFDDCSTDRTVAIAEGFAKRDTRIKVFVNETNLGYTRNFEKAISFCDTGLIALSDQDDVWFKYKLERLSAELEAHPGAGMAFSNAELMSSDGRRTGHLLFDRAFGLSDAPEQARRSIFKSTGPRNIHGHLMLLESGMKDLIVPNPIVRSYGHDAWICLNAFFLRAPRYIPEPLSLYRLHPTQASGAVFMALKGTQYEFKKKWYDHRRVIRNIKRELLAPFRRRAILRERELRAYHYAIDMLTVIDKLLAERKRLGLPQLPPEEESLFQDLKGEWKAAIDSFEGR